MSKKKNEPVIVCGEVVENCPLCGGKAEVREFRGMFRHGWVGCVQCGCYINWNHDPAGAIAKWNKRVNIIVA